MGCCHGDEDVLWVQQNCSFDSRAHDPKIQGHLCSVCWCVCVYRERERRKDREGGGGKRERERERERITHDVW